MVQPSATGSGSPLSDLPAEKEQQVKKREIENKITKILNAIKTSSVGLFALELAGKFLAHASSSWGDLGEIATEVRRAGIEQLGIKSETSQTIKTMEGRLVAANEHLVQDLNQKVNELEKLKGKQGEVARQLHGQKKLVENLTVRLSQQIEEKEKNQTLDNIEACQLSISSLSRDLSRLNTQITEYESRINELVDEGEILLKEASDYRQSVSTWEETALKLKVAQTDLRKATLSLKLAEATSKASDKNGEAKAALGKARNRHANCTNRVNDHLSDEVDHRGRIGQLTNRIGRHLDMLTKEYGVQTHTPGSPSDEAVRVEKRTRSRELFDDIKLKRELANCEASCDQVMQEIAVSLGRLKGDKEEESRLGGDWHSWDKRKSELQEKYRTFQEARKAQRQNAASLVYLEGLVQRKQPLNKEESEQLQKAKAQENAMARAVDQAHRGFQQHLGMIEFDLVERYGVRPDILDKIGVTLKTLSEIAGHLVGDVKAKASDTLQMIQDRIALDDLTDRCEDNIDKLDKALELVREAKEEYRSDSAKNRDQLDVLDQQERGLTGERAAWERRKEEGRRLCEDLETLRKEYLGYARIVAKLNTKPQLTEVEEASLNHARRNSESLQDQILKAEFAFKGVLGGLEMQEGFEIRKSDQQIYDDFVRFSDEEIRKFDQRVRQLQDDVKRLLADLNSEKGKFTPELAQAFETFSRTTNPADLAKAASNPKVAEYLTKERELSESQALVEAAGSKKIMAYVTFEGLKLASGDQHVQEARKAFEEACQIGFKEKVA